MHTTTSAACVETLGCVCTTPHPCVQVYNFNIPTFGPGVVYDVDIKVRNEQFRWLGEALKGKKLLSYIPGFVKEAQVLDGCGRIQTGDGVVWMG